jgi:hypothetical protein
LSENNLKQFSKKSSFPFLYLTVARLLGFRIYTGRLKSFISHRKYFFLGEHAQECWIVSKKNYGRLGDPAVRKHFYQRKRSEICMVCKGIVLNFCADSSEIICIYYKLRNFARFFSQLTRQVCQFATVLKLAQFCLDQE